MKECWRHDLKDCKYDGLGIFRFRWISLRLKPQILLLFLFALNEVLKLYIHSVEILPVICLFKNIVRKSIKRRYLLLCLLRVLEMSSSWLWNDFAWCLWHSYSHSRLSECIPHFRSSFSVRIYKIHIWYMNWKFSFDCLGSSDSFLILNLFISLWSEWMLTKLTPDTRTIFLFLHTFRTFPCFLQYLPVFTSTLIVIWGLLSLQMLLSIFLMELALVY